MIFRADEDGTLAVLLVELMLMSGVVTCRAAYSTSGIATLNSITPRALSFPRKSLSEALLDAMGTKIVLTTEIQAWAHHARSVMWCVDQVRSRSKRMSSDQEWKMHKLADAIEDEFNVTGVTL